MPPPAPATKAPLKILLVRDETLGHRVRSLMADESTLYWRSSDPPKDLETSLGEEHFGLIIADYRETKTDVLDAVEALRKRHPESDRMNDLLQFELLAAQNDLGVGLPFPQRFDCIEHIRFRFAVVRDDQTKMLLPQRRLQILRRIRRPPIKRRLIRHQRAHAMAQGFISDEQNLQGCLRGRRGRGHGKLG